MAVAPPHPTHDSPQSVKPDPNLRAAFASTKAKVSPFIFPQSALIWLV